jgi:hypothetical protein
VSNPTIGANEAHINSSPDCSGSLLNFFCRRLIKTKSAGQASQRNTATLAKLDWNVSASNKLSASYNFTTRRGEPDIRRTTSVHLQRNRGTVESAFSI